MYVIIKLTITKGSFYTLRCESDEYSRLVEACKGAKNSLSIEYVSAFAQDIYDELEVNALLRAKEYMFTTFKELVALIKEVFQIEV